MKDYYQILGVLPTAEEIAIRAAYRVFTRFHHSDEHAGNKDEYSRRMAEVSEAYDVLSDPDKRREYDSMSHPGAGRYDAQALSADQLEPYRANWGLACSVYPDLNRIGSDLKQISPRLESTYRIFMLELKLFARRQEIAETMEDQFLAGYFGDSPKLKAYGRQIILDGFREAALALNKLVSILGDSDPDTLLVKIEQDYPIPQDNRVRAKEQAEMEQARVEESGSQKAETNVDTPEKFADRPVSPEVYQCRVCNYKGRMILIPLDEGNPQRLNGLICPSCGNQTGR
jgi:curved DNA-binding protein CbpA